MKMIGIGRLGRNAELRYLPSGDAVLNMAVAFNYGQKDGGGNRPTQWLECALFGKRAEALAPYLLKGTQAEFTVGDPHIETYPRNSGGEGVKLTGRLVDVELVGSKRDAATDTRPQQTGGGYPPSEQHKGQQAGSFEEFDDDIPF